MSTISVSRAIRGEGTDGPVGSKIWECMRSQEKKGMIIFLFLYFD